MTRWRTWGDASCTGSRSSRRARSPWLAAIAALEDKGMTIRAFDREALRPAAERLWTSEAAALGVTPWLEAIRA